MTIKWRKSSRSATSDNTNCVEVADLAPAWRKSSRSNPDNGNCVELAGLPGRVGVRDSKNPDGPAFALSAASFRALVRDVKAGHHDMP
ncbi:DUF397 domain-containing protein [Actinomadura terrae]|uniref:DUF397 domain-containing protein n=1 Tax=Actinomadura terrae TaxID=604353 RepID=UPI001FA7E5C5|nr:DUF397 domain-containing protein [Actinomadura terrae]